MNKMPQTDFKKITQALNYLANGYKGKRLNKLKAIKLMWLADRYHLRKYGRPITWDIYEAMKLGPVGSIAKDVAEQSSFLDSNGRKYSSKYLNPIDKNTYESKLPTDIKVFSQSDIEALDFALSNYGDWKKFDLKDLAHLYPEWKKFESSIESGARSKVRMDYADFFLDPSEVKDDIFKIDHDILTASKDIYSQLKSISDARISG